MAKLIVKRKKEWNNRASFSLIVDGEKFDSIGNGEIKEYDLPAGKHTIKAQVTWHFSQEIEIELNEEKSKLVELNINKYIKWATLYTLLIIAAFYIARFVMKVPANPLIYAVIPGLLVSLYFTTLGRKKYIDIE